MASSELMHQHPRSKPMSLLGTILCECKDFGAVFGHEQRVFELGRERVIACPDGPFIAFIEDGFPGADVEHGFDGETGSRMEEFAGGDELWHVRDAGFLMEVATDAVSLVFADDRVAGSGGERLDSAADFDHGTARVGCGDTDEERIESGLDEPFCGSGDFADKKCFGLVAVPAIDDGGDIDIDDIA